MPHKLHEKYLNSDFEAKKKYEARIEKREHKGIGFSAICFLVVHWVLPCPMDRTRFPEVEGFVGERGRNRIESRCVTFHCPSASLPTTFRLR